MRLRWLILIIPLIILILVLGFLFLPKTKVCFDKHCFKVEIADTPKERETGLMFVTQLDKNKGMLFIYPGLGEYSFWMKNTFIPLDTVWLDSQRKVVYVSKNTQPCVTEDCPSIGSEVLSQYVLEINGGLIDIIGLKVGDRVEITKGF